MTSTEEEILRDKLNAETGKLSWEELQRHFARGVVVVVGGELDLIDVAVKMALDDSAAFEAWLCAGTVQRAGAEHAERWRRDAPQMWAVVVAPWVLVQEARAAVH